MPTKLRPIGTEFTIEYPPSLNSTETRWTRHLNRVVRHVDVMVDRMGNTKKMEEIKCLSVELFDRPHHWESTPNGYICVADDKEGYNDS